MPYSYDVWALGAQSHYGLYSWPPCRHSTAGRRTSCQSNRIKNALTDPGSWRSSSTPPPTVAFRLWPSILILTTNGELSRNYQLRSRTTLIYRQRRQIRTQTDTTITQRQQYLRLRRQAGLRAVIDVSTLRAGRAPASQQPLPAPACRPLRAACPTASYSKPSQPDWLNMTSCWR